MIWKEDNSKMFFENEETEIKDETTDILSDEPETVADDSDKADETAEDFSPNEENESVSEIQPEAELLDEPAENEEDSEYDPDVVVEDTGDFRSEIVIYQTDDGSVALDVPLENETVWLNDVFEYPNLRNIMYLNVILMTDGKEEKSFKVKLPNFKEACIGRLGASVVLELAAMNHLISSLNSKTKTVWSFAPKKHLSYSKKILKNSKEKR